MAKDATNDAARAYASQRIEIPPTELKQKSSGTQVFVPGPFWNSLTPLASEAASNAIVV